MSGPYWDVRTCSWQGGAPPQAPPPVHVRARRAELPAQPVPAQPTPADAEPVEAVARAT